MKYAEADINGDWTDNELPDPLDLVFENEVGKVSMKVYFWSMLLSLWREGESFSGKRPLGNSDWDYVVYAALIKAGYIEGEVDEDGCVEKFDTRRAHRWVLNNIIGRMI